MNWHAFLHLDGPDETGKVVDWQIELGAPIPLRRTGWTPETLRIGMEIKVVGSPSVAEGRTAWLRADDAARWQPVSPGGRVQKDRPEVPAQARSRWRSSTSSDKVARRPYMRSFFTGDGTPAFRTSWRA
jgi:hypothetical protein